MIEPKPPRILFVFAPLGRGHSTVVRALSETSQDPVGPRVDINVLNVLSSSCSRFPLTAIPWLYRFFTVKQPWLWRVLYCITNNPIGFALAERLAQPFLQPGLRCHLARWQPDIVVSVFPALGRSIDRALSSIGSTVPIVTVVTDLVTVHAAWICNVCAAYLVATPEAADAFAKAGIPRERIRCYGLPVLESFIQQRSHRAELRRSLRLDTDVPMVLLMGGGEGSGHLASIVEALANACRDAQLVVITGNNHALRQYLTSRRFAVPCTILGYVDNVDDWMFASDLLITKAGPTTVTEALHTGLPMILTDSLPQEAGTIRYLVEHGAARFASQARDIAATVVELLDQPGHLELLRRNGKALRGRNAARDIATFIWQVATQPVTEANTARANGETPDC
jgi:1,2-diacylglycerol 3-beta-galactosyltransferase